MSDEIHPNHARHRALMRTLCGDHPAKRYVLADVPWDADHDALGIYGDGVSYATSGIVVDTATYDLVGYDGGEPEDQTLGRDWSWVVDALNAAFEAGRQAALAPPPVPQIQHPPASADSQQHGDDGEDV